MYILRGFIVASLAFGFPVVAQDNGEKPGDRRDKIDRSIEKGIYYLLKTQKNRRWYWVEHGVRKHQYTPAVTSIVSMALLSFPDIQFDRSIKAIKKALFYVLKSGNIGEPYFTFLFLKNCLNHRQFQEDRKLIKKKMEGILNDIVRAQRKGKWGYLSTESISTALVLLMLKEAQDAGFDIPQRVIKRGIRALKRMRKAPGVFTYAGRVGSGDSQRMCTKMGSLGRGCVCELALLMWGATKREDLQKAVKNFFKYRRFILVRTLKRNRKGTHHGPYGIAPYYFFFAHYFASIAVGKLGEELVDRYYPKLTRWLIKMQSEEGYWLDSNCTGKDYGTGIVLLTLARTITENRAKETIAEVR